MKRLLYILILCFAMQIAGAELFVFGNHLYFLGWKAKSVSKVGEPHQPISLPVVQYGIVEYAKTKDWEYAFSFAGLYARKLEGTKAWQLTRRNVGSYSASLGEYLYTHTGEIPGPYRIFQFKGRTVERSWDSICRPKLSNGVGFMSDYKTLVIVGTNGKPVTYHLSRTFPKGSRLLGTTRSAAYIYGKKQIFYYNLKTRQVRITKRTVLYHTLVKDGALYFVESKGKRCYVKRWNGSSLKSLELPANNVDHCIIASDGKKIGILAQESNPYKVYAATISTGSAMRIMRRYSIAGMVLGGAMWHDHLWAEILNYGKSSSHSTLHEVP